MPLRLHPAITISSNRILRVAGARPLPFAAFVGRDGGAASIGQPQNAAAIFPGVLVHLDAAIRLERHHVNERISVRQERRQAFNEVVEVSPECARRLSCRCRS